MPASNCGAVDDCRPALMTAATIKHMWAQRQLKRCRSAGACYFLQMARTIDIGAAPRRQPNEKRVEALNEADGVGIRLLGHERRQPAGLLFAGLGDKDARLGVRRRRPIFDPVGYCGSTLFAPMGLLCHSAAGAARGVVVGIGVVAFALEVPSRVAQARLPLGPGAS